MRITKINTFYCFNLPFVRTQRVFVYTSFLKHSVYLKYKRIWLYDSIKKNRTILIMKTKCIVHLFLNKTSKLKKLEIYQCQSSYLKKIKQE